MPGDEASGRVPFGDLLKDFRTKAGLSQAAVARRAGLDTSYVSRLERSSGTTPRSDTLSRLVGAMGLNSEDTDVFLAAATGVSPRAESPSYYAPSQASRPMPAAAPLASDSSSPIPTQDAEDEDPLADQVQNLESRISYMRERLDAVNADVLNLSRQASLVARSMQEKQEERTYLEQEVHRMHTELNGLMTFMVNEARRRG